MKDIFLEYLFKSTAEVPVVYLVVGAGDMPFIEPPIYPDIDEVTSEYDPNTEEATLNAFTSYEGAEDFQRHLVESLELKPSSLKIIKLTIADVWTMLDEMSELANKEYDSGLKVRLLNAVAGEHVIASDVIYSQEALYH